MTGVGQGRMSVTPGNAGGAKGPDFWHAFEDGEVKVIGDEPANTDYDPDLSGKLLSQGEGCVSAEVSSQDISSTADCRVPCGEANRKAECRKSARSV